MAGFFAGAIRLDSARGFWAWVDRFPPGRVPLLLIVLAVLSAGLIAYREVQPKRTDFEVWTFTHISYDEFRQILAEIPQGDDVRVRNLGSAMFDRLAISIATQTELPDLVEIEQSRVGQYLRGPIEHIPFVDLTERIEREGWGERVVKARFAKYSVDGHIFGIPHDLHPMVLAYRPDLLAEMGYTPDDLATWERFIEVAQDFYQPGEIGSKHWRRALPLKTTEAWDFLLLLWQRGGDVFDAEGEVVIDSPLAVDTLTFFVSLFEMDPPVASPALSGMVEEFGALEDGHFLAYPVADWGLAAMQLNEPQDRTALADRVQIAPLPAWESGGRRTSTIGGTAMFIPRHTPDVDRAWELAKFLYFDDAALVARFEEQSIVPPLVDIYSATAFSKPRPFFGSYPFVLFDIGELLNLGWPGGAMAIVYLPELGRQLYEARFGQRVGLILTELALEVPPVNGSPYMPEAEEILNRMMIRVFEGNVQPAAALQRAAEELRAVMRRDRATIEQMEGA